VRREIGTLSTPAVAALQNVTETVPIVFVNANDPIRFGLYKAWLGRAEISPDSSAGSRQSAESGWSY
jgi:hypothetical protein